MPFKVDLKQGTKPIKVGGKQVFDGLKYIP